MIVLPIWFFYLILPAKESGMTVLYEMSLDDVNNIFKSPKMMDLKKMFIFFNFEF